MADEQKDDAGAYLAKLKTWGLYVAAILALSIASALAQRWIGKDVELPPPPVILIEQTEDGTTVSVVKANQTRWLECGCDLAPAGQCPCGSDRCARKGGHGGCSCAVKAKPIPEAGGKCGCKPHAPGTPWPDPQHCGSFWCPSNGGTGGCPCRRLNPFPKEK